MAAAVLLPLVRGETALTMEIKNQLVRGSGSAFAIKVAGAGASLGMQVLLAHLLGAENFGEYVYIVTWINMLSMAAKAGLDAAGQRFIVEHNSTEDWGELRGFLSASRSFTWMLSLGLGLVLVGVVLILRGRICDSLFEAFCVGAVLLPFMTRMQVLEAGLRAYKRIFRAQAPQELLRPILIIGGILIGAGCLGRPLNAAEALGVNTLATVLILVLAAGMLHRTLPAAVFKARPIFRWRKWLSVGFSLMATDGFYLVIAQADIIMIGAFLGTRLAGIYAVSSRLATLISFGIIAVNTIVAPMISELNALDKRNELKSLLKMAAMWTALASVPIAVLLMLAGRWMLGWFGPEFVIGYPVLLIMSIGQILNSLAASTGVLMTMTGHHVKVVRIVGVSSGLNVLFNALAIPLLGMWGAAAVSVLTTVVWNAAMLSFVVRKMGINPTLFQRWRKQ